MMSEIFAFSLSGKFQGLSLAIQLLLTCCKWAVLKAVDSQEQINQDFLLNRKDMTREVK